MPKAGGESPAMAGGAAAPSSNPKRSFSVSNLFGLMSSSATSSSSSPLADGGGKAAVQQQQHQAQRRSGMTRAWSADDFARVSDGENLKRCPYSSVVRSPCPYEFQMPVHYPRFTKAQYESMPEWQVDQLLEEYGLPAPAMGSLREKREYAIGSFLWKGQQQ